MYEAATAAAGGRQGGCLIAAPNRAAQRRNVIYIRFAPLPHGGPVDWFDSSSRVHATVARGPCGGCRTTDDETASQDGLQRGGICQADLVIIHLFLY
jgi:hypothetical protein